MPRKKSPPAPAPANPVARPAIGRPTTWDEAIGRQILEAIKSGANIIEAAEINGVNATTLYDWQAKGHTVDGIGFAQGLAHARRLSAGAILRKAEKALLQADRENIQVVREWLHHARWLAKAHDPGTYSDNVNVNLLGQVQLTAADLAPEWMQAKLVEPAVAQIVSLAHQGDKAEADQGDSQDKAG